MDFAVAVVVAAADVLKLFGVAKRNQRARVLTSHPPATRQRGERGTCSRRTHRIICSVAFYPTASILEKEATMNSISRDIKSRDIESRDIAKSRPTSFQKPTLTPAPVNGTIPRLRTIFNSFIPVAT